MAGTVSAGTIIYDVDMDTAGILRGRREIDAALSGLSGSLGRVEGSVNRTERSIASMERAMSSLTGIAKGLLAALSVQQVGAYADAWTDLNNKVANSLRTGEGQAQVMQRIFDISQATQSSLNGTATLYARLERGTRLYNTSAADLVKLTTIINQGFAVSGATAQEAENAIIQLSQGLAAGALRGEEYNSVAEQGSRLTNALADSMGVSIGQLRAMAAQGKLTTDVVVNGLLSQGDAIGKEFANTTVTMAKGLQVAGNNLTKFFGENSTVKSFAAGFRDSVISVSENLEALSSVLLVLAGVMGSRYVGALTMATSAKVQDTAATIASAKASELAARDAELEAAAKLRLANVEKAATIQALQLAEGRLATIRSTQAATVAEVKLAEAEAASIRTTIAQIESEKLLETQRLKAQISEQGRIATATRMAQLQQASAVLSARLATAESASAQARAAAIASAESSVSAARLATADATGVATAANGRYIASQAATVAAARASSVALGLASRALSLIGGPAGAAMLAAGAIFYFWQKAQQAKKEAIAFADGLDKLNASMTSMSNTSLRGAIADANTSIRAQKDAVAELQSEVDALNSRYQNFTPAAKKAADSMGQGTDYARQQAEVSDMLARKTRDLEMAKDKLSRTEDTASEATRTLTNNLLTAMGAHDQLIEKSWSLEQVQGAVAKAFGNTADEITRVNQASQQFNPKAIQISPATKEGDKVIENLKDQNELLEIQDERQRAIVKARQQAAKVTDNQNQIAAAERLAAENFDLEKAEDARKKAQQESEQQSKKTASAEESVAQKLANLKQQSELAADSTREFSREQAILKAQQSLGKAATQDQIKLAGEYAAKTWDVANALKMRQEAEQATRFVNQEVSVAKVQRDPYTGEAVDPYAQINEEESRKLEALRKYQQLGAVDAQQYEDGKTAIMQQAANERINIAQDESRRQVDVMNTLLGGLGDSFSGLAEIISKSSGDTSDAYRVLFGIGKGFAVAQAGLNLQLALSNAMASGPFPWNLSAMASVAAAGGSLISSIAGATYGGARKNGGPVSAGEMYRVGEGGMPEIYQASSGRQYMIPGDNGKVISNKDMQGGGGSGAVIHQTVEFHIQTTGGIDDATMAKMSTMMKQVSINTIRDQQRPNGLLQRSR